jgi:hypothetical protein
MNVIQANVEVSATNHHPTGELMMSVGPVSHSHTEHCWTHHVEKLEL